MTVLQVGEIREPQKAEERRNKNRFNYRGLRMRCSGFSDLEF